MVNWLPGSLTTNHITTMNFPHFLVSTLQVHFVTWEIDLGLLNISMLFHG